MNPPVLMCSPPRRGRSWGERHGVGWMRAGGHGRGGALPSARPPMRRAAALGAETGGRVAWLVAALGGDTGGVCAAAAPPDEPPLPARPQQQHQQHQQHRRPEPVQQSVRGEGAARARAAGSGVLCGDLAASWTTVAPSSTSAPSTCSSGFCSSSCWQCADSAGSFHQRDCGQPVGAREARRRARARGARGGSARFEPDPVAAATGGDSAGWP